MRKDLKFTLRRMTLNFWGGGVIGLQAHLHSSWLEVFFFCLFWFFLLPFLIRLFFLLDYGLGRRLQRLKWHFYQVKDATYPHCNPH